MKLKQKDGEHVTRVAEYVRMSTDKQEYSIENQREFIKRYADEHSMEIVRTYADRGKSGVVLKGRTALCELMKDVHEIERDFDAVLVYDVSRWGRFQDIDEAAHYEFICRRAGVPIVYCAEEFAGASPMSSVVKSIKRTMAAEFSRELGEKILASQLRVAKLGFHAAGPGLFGYRRVVVDQHGTQRRTLGPKEAKRLRSDRIRLTLGPRSEVNTIRRIFRLAAEGHTPAEIARLMNRRGSRSCTGIRWNLTSVRRLIVREEYTGCTYFNRVTRRLGAAPSLNPRGLWVSQPIAPIVSPSLFRAAIEGIKSRRSARYSDEQMFEALRRVAAKNKGRLSNARVLASGCAPSLTSMAHRFGSSVLLFHRLGYKVDKAMLGRALSDERARLITNKLIMETLEALLEAGVNCKRPRRYVGRIQTDSLWLNITFKRAPRVPHPVSLLTSLRDSHIALVARTSLRGDEFLKFYLFDLRAHRTWRIPDRADAIGAVVALVCGRPLFGGEPMPPRPELPAHCE